MQMTQDSILHPFAFEQVRPPHSLILNTIFALHEPQVAPLGCHQGIDEVPWGLAEPQKEGPAPFVLMNSTHCVHDALIQLQATHTVSAILQHR